MEIILLEEIEKVGEKHEVVKVRDGYGRNYLIPQGLAIIANKTNMAKLEAFRAKEAAEQAAIKGKVEEIAAQLQDVVIKIGAKTGTSGKIFGSVNPVQVSQAIKEQVNLDIDRRKISLAEEIKEVGTYQAKINLHKEVPIMVTLEVAGE